MSYTAPTPPSNVLDELALAAVAARVNPIKCENGKCDYLDRSQINKLIELNETVDGFTLLLYLVRQMSRKEWERVSGTRLYRVLNNLISNVRDIKEQQKVLRIALSYFKWFFECWELNPQNDLRKQYSNYLRNPNMQAPQGFAQTYLKTLLRI
ncbi:MAG: hypothetical protein QXT53_06125 [Ignisphaera sp.]